MIDNNKLLREISTELDISDTAYEQFVARYKSVGEWLVRDESIVAGFSPIVYPQGSVELGTIVKPISNADEYDIDLVCELKKLSKNVITQKRLKDNIGVEIGKYATSHQMNSKPENNRRCWTLNYAESSKFHMDILPAIPDGVAFNQHLKNRGFSIAWGKDAIAITDKETETYSEYSEDWPQSNPKGYIEWFQGRMRPKDLFEARKSRVDEVAQYKRKTPLQRSVQLLKRHRDIMFDGDEDKPISIIITTLAAHAYQGEKTVSDTLWVILNNMESCIQIRDGIAWIANPANPNENFADKWPEHQQRKDNFKQWVEKAQKDFNFLLESQTITFATNALAPVLGEQLVEQATERILETKRKSVTLPAQTISSFSKVNFNVSHRKLPIWPRKFSGDVTIKCKRSKDGFTDKVVPNHNTIPIPKRWSLSFQARTNIPRPYKIYWQIVNTGAEAQEAKQLRGDFCDGDIYQGHLKWKESTLYHGSHWIECFIVKNGFLAARSGEFVVSIE